MAVERWSRWPELPILAERGKITSDVQSGADVEMDNRRQHYRIIYPVTERPRFAYCSSISEVIECSERGLRFRTAGAPPAEGARISGRLAMCHGEELRVSGTVVWSDEAIIALHLDRGPIPFLAIMREQLYLRKVARRTG